MNTIVRSLSKKIIAAMLAVVFLAQPLLVPHIAFAASLTSLSDTMSTVKKTTLADHAISYVTPTGVASTQTIILTFASDYDGTVDPQGTLDFNDVDLLEDTTPDGVCDGTGETLVASSPSLSEWSAAFSGGSSRVLTFTSGGTSAVIAAGSEVCIKIGENATGGSANSQYTNPTTAGTYALAITGSGGDTGTISATIVNDDTVSVSATVGQSLTFSISSNSITFGTLSTSAARYADGSTGSGSDTVAHTVAVATNGTSGYTITVKGATLTSGLNTITANGSTAAASSTGAEQFGIYATKSGGVNGTIDATYADSGTPAFGYDGSASTAATFATGSSATATETYSLHYISNIAATTEAGSYTAALVYVATANF